MRHQYARIDNADEIRNFIRDLRDALKKSEKNNGGYSAFLHNDEGDVIFQLEIAAKIRARR